MRSFSKKLAFVLAAAMVVTAFAPAAKAEAAKEMAINKQGKILYVTDGTGINDAAQVGGGKGNVSSYDFAVSNKPADWKTAYTFKWLSSDEDVITVKNGGLTTAVGVGKADVVCVVTEKATGKATTLKNTVTVKANAAEVALKDTSKDGAAVVAGDVVDLDRVMIDAAGNKTTKRGKLVTDYTRWIAEPSTGVTINQSNGQFTFGDDAVAGDYTLYCETYQSNKYKAATATSDKIVVTFVADTTFEVAQKSATKFTINFESPVKSLATSDVTMVKRLELATGNYDYPQAVKAVALAKDGMSADVTLFSGLTHNSKYIVSVNGFEDLPFTASLGNPARIEIAAKDAIGGEVLTTNKPAEILVTYYDEKGVEVTPANPTVIFRLETRSTDGSFYLAGKNLTIKKEGVTATVIAEYQGRIENGKRVGQLDTQRTFAAVAQAPVVVKALAGKTLTDWNNPSMTMRLNSGTKKLQVKFSKTDNTTTDALTAGSTFDNYKVSFTALDPSIAVISATGDVTAFKTGNASFYVNLAEKQSNGTYGTANPVAVVDVTVQAKETFAYTTINNNASITVGTADGFNTGSFELAGVDSYGQAWPITSGVTLECTTDGFAKQDFAAAFAVTYANNKATIAVDAADILAVLTAKSAAPKAGEAAILFFTATYNKYVVDFSVMIQVPGAEDGNYIQVVASTDNIDALRVDEWQKDSAKSISFEVFEMNNGVKVDTLDFVAYPASASAVSEGTYCYKVTKDGKDVTSAVKNGNKVTLALSYNEADANGVSIVKYLGDGTYEFALFQCYGTGENAVLVQEYSNVVNVYVSDAGSYYVAGDLVNNKVASGSDDAAILACFNINDRSNKPVVKNGVKNAECKYDSYVVTKTAVADAGYVYVEKITFYESLGDANVAYVVNVDTVLQIGQ